MKDFYYILGLDANCSLDEIKAAYRKLSKKLHPDLNQGDEYFENRFKDIKEAFETLRDPLKRRLYDEQLIKFKSGQPREEPPTQRPAGRAYKYTSYKSNNQYTGTKPGKIRRKGPGVGLSVTMIIMGCILAVYTVRWFISSKPKKQVAYVVADSTATPPPFHKKHRRKHAKAIVAAKTEKRSFDTAKIIAIKPSIMKPMAIKPGPVAPQVQVKPEPLRPMITKAPPDSSKTHSDYLYTTYVHPNVTGIVQMREYDRFNSHIIASIPANSRVFVLERGNTYYRVFYAKSIGFVPKWSLKQQ